MSFKLVRFFLGTSVPEKIFTIDRLPHYITVSHQRECEQWYLRVHSPSVSCFSSSSQFLCFFSLFNGKFHFVEDERNEWYLFSRNLILIRAFIKLFELSSNLFRLPIPLRFFPTHLHDCVISTYASILCDFLHHSILSVVPPSRTYPLVDFTKRKSLHLIFRCKPTHGSPHIVNKKKKASPSVLIHFWQFCKRVHQSLTLYFPRNVFTCLHENLLP